MDAYTYLSLTNLLMWPGGANFKATDTFGELVGFVAGSPNWGSHTDWIVTLGVHPAHQRQGLGHQLLTTCEAHMSQPLLALTVRVSNEPAIRLYQTAGYVTAYYEPAYYNDGEDGMVMHKKRLDVHLYPNAAHAFHRPNWEGHSPLSAADAWQKTIAFLHRFHG